MDKLPNIPQSHSKKANNKRRKAHPFWNDELSDLWKDRCIKEKQYCSFRCQNRQDRPIKEDLRQQFQQSQKCFDKKLRFYKRKAKSNNMRELEEAAKFEPAEMWKRIKALSDA